MKYVEGHETMYMYMYLHKFTVVIASGHRLRGFFFGLAPMLATVICWASNGQVHVSSVLTGPVHAVCLTSFMQRGALRSVLTNVICLVSSTFVCPTEIIAFSDRSDEFRAINCEVVACSTDSHFSHLAWSVLVSATYTDLNMYCAKKIFHQK